MVQALRPSGSFPAGSRTRLLSNAFMSCDNLHSIHTITRPGSFDILRQPDGFESWDTSAVEEAYTESPTVRKSKSKSRLESIPGSRPVSSARPLDGPFSPSHTAPEDLPLPESPSYSTLSPSTSMSSLRNHDLSSLRRPLTAQTQIHPLFRPDCPMPPPLTSPTTVIMASPFAGQIVSPSQASSIKSFRMQGPSPVEPSPLRSP